MTSRELLTADLHLTANPQDEYRWGVFDQLLAAAEKNGVRRIAILGDLTDHKDNHPSYLVNRIVRGIVRLTSVAEVLLLAGNHDYVEQSCPFFKFLRYVPRVHFVTKAEYMEHERTLVIPHSRDFEAVLHEMRRPLSKARLVLMHQTISGADVGHTKLKGEDVALLRRAKGFIFSGDVHVPQSCSGVVYIGAPYQVKYGDGYTGRFILVNGDEYSSIKTKFPRKLKVSVTEAEDLDVKMIQPKDQVKVEIMVTHRTISRYREIKTTIEKQLEKIGAVAVIHLNSTRLTAHDTKEKCPVASAVSPGEFFSQYCAAAKFSSKLIEYGRDLMDGIDA